MKMNNTKIGGRISEIDIIRFVLERLNDNAQGIKFRMGLTENFLWYKPMSELSKLINKDYLYDEETYESIEYDFVPTLIVIADMGLTSNLDFLSGSGSVNVRFLIPADDPYESELHRLVIEELRDTLRQGFFVSEVPQRPYKNNSAVGTYKTFKFNTNTGTINYGGQIETINSKQFIELDFDIDIDFNDMAIIGNEYLIEMAIKNGENSYSDYERVYPISVGMGVAHATKDKQEQFVDAPKTLSISNVSAYETAYFKFEVSSNPNTMDLTLFPIGSIIKYNNTYVRVDSTTSPFEEQKSWEVHSRWQSKGFSLVMDFIYRKQYSNEKVGIITHLFNDLVKKKFGYNIYKIRISKYNLEADGTWTFEYTLFERNMIMLANETVIELGSLQPMTIPFAVSDIE